VESRPAGDETLLVDALAIAWTAARLYDDPRENEAFQRAVAVLAAAPRRPWAVQVGPGGFRVGDTPIPSRREAAGGLARLLFSHTIGVIEIVGRPTADDVLHLCQVVMAPPEEISESGGPDDELRRRGVTTIEVAEFAMPVKRCVVEGEGAMEAEPADVAEDAEAEPLDGAATVARDPDATEGFVPNEPEPLHANEAEPGPVEPDNPWFAPGDDADPRPFISRLLGDAGADSAAIGRQFLDEYLAVFELLEDDDPWGREEIVHGFVEAFFHLDHDGQGAVLTAFLREREQEPCSLFLDQFGEWELGVLASHLPKDAHPLLLEYTRIAAQYDDGARHATLLGLLEAGAPAGSPHGQVMERVDALLTQRDEGDGTEPVGRLSKHRPGYADHARASFSMMRGLFATAENPAAFSALLKPWAARLAGAIKDRDAAGAAGWIGSALDADRSAATRTLMARAVAEHVDSGFVAGLVAILTDKSRAAEPIRATAWLFPTSQMVRRLAAEENRGRRRMLIDALTACAKADPDPLLVHLEDTRWYLVRNIVLILGRSGHSEIAGRLLAVGRHEEPRVRREVLRALGALLEDGSTRLAIAALEDPDAGVRRQAMAQLRPLPNPEVDEALEHRLAAADDMKERLKIINELAARGTDRARDALRRRARIKLGWTKEIRTLRAAARDALRRTR
jgi:hypothetical protein